MKSGSLRSKITNQTLVIILIVGAGFLAAVVGQSYFQSRLGRGAVLRSLKQSARTQVEELIPTFLLPEQKMGAELLLRKIQQDEQLDSVTVLPTVVDIDPSFAGCASNKKDGPSDCLSLGGRSIGVLAPIAEGGRVFGYLLKTKRLDAATSDEQLLKLIEVVAIVLLCIFVFIFSAVTKITAKEVPDSIEMLLKWLESNLSGVSPNEKPNLRFDEFNRLAERMAETIEESQRARDQIKLGKLASQVAHDVRSPLAALENFVLNTRDLPEENRILVRTAVNRIKDIANNLVEKNREIITGSKGKCKITDGDSMTDESHVVALLSSLIDVLITEKRSQFRDRLGIEIHAQLGPSSYGLFAKVQPTEFKRLLSNLVNNAVEVLGDQGTVVISLKEEQGQVELAVTDNGKGIPPEILLKLGQRGESHGKVGGSGLGLYHARTTVEGWSGNLKIESQVGRGTTVRIRLPKVPAPSWFVSKLILEPESHVVILDDDSSIHRIWQGRFDFLKIGDRGIRVHHFSTPDELKKWVAESSTGEAALYLADYELLGHRETGLDLIESLKIGRQSILVTSRFEEAPIRDACIRQNVRMIPKGIAGLVPISIEEPLPLLDAVQLDDDDLVLTTWRSIANQNKKALASFCEPNSFFAAITGIDRRSPIFVDSNLKDGIKGEQLIGRIRALGFENVYLATGYEPSTFKHVAGLSGIVGKEPPVAIGGVEISTI